MSFLPHHNNMELAIFRLEDVCVRIQDEMEGFLQTAALEKSAEIEAIFRWLNKRRIKIALLSDYNRADTEILLQRLGWRVGEAENIMLVLTDQLTNSDPVRCVLDLVGLKDGAAVFSVFDTPRLLHLADANRLKLNLGITNGSCSYVALAGAPHHALLDKLIQLPDFLLRHLYPASEVPMSRKSLFSGGFFFPLRSFFW